MLIRYAYESRDAEMVGLPPWADDERFDVIAKALLGASAGDLRAMVRTLPGTVVITRSGGRASARWRDPWAASSDVPSSTAPA